MKRGDKVAVCHDGKWGRRVLGEVVATRNGHHIKVAFPHPENDSVVEFWARKEKPVRYQQIKQRNGYCKIICLKSYTYFGGWADIDWFSPWYSVHKWKESN